MDYIKKLFSFKSMSLESKMNIAGYLFVLPFLVGFVLFFLVPFVQSFIFSVSELKLTETGYVLNSVFMKNYQFALLEHAEFVRTFVESIVNMISDLPLIIFFSFFAAILLNQKFRGRLLARSIFFIPIILTSGVILSLEGSDYMTQALSGLGSVSGEEEEAVRLGPIVYTFIRQLQLPEMIIDYITMAVNNMPDIIRASAIQILIFLAGLQSIPRALYECAEVEGATRWESFWFITFPMMSPIILINVVYTIIDSVLDTSNDLVILIQDTAFSGEGFGVSTAMGIMYFLAVGILIFLVVIILSRWVFYHE
ncbi:MAG: carbohydrate ABC transporter permease [bacterium]